MRILASAKVFRHTMRTLLGETLGVEADSTVGILAGQMAHVSSGNATRTPLAVNSSPGRVPAVIFLIDSRINTEANTVPRQRRHTAASIRRSYSIESDFLDDR